MYLWFKGRNGGLAVALKILRILAESRQWVSTSQIVRLVYEPNLYRTKQQWGRHHKHIYRLVNALIRSGIPIEKDRDLRNRPYLFRLPKYWYSRFIDSLKD